MKKVFVILWAAGLIGLTASTLQAGGIINKNNQSADYMRTLNRAAATDLADIAVYNPAGIMQMDDGMYTKLDVLYFDKDYSNTVENGFGIFAASGQPFGMLQQDKSSTIPAFFAILKRERWAGFLALTIPAGGGDLDYEEGNARTVNLASQIGAGINLADPGSPGNPVLPYNFIASQSEELKKSEAYSITFGGSYAVNGQLSLAGGLRYAYSEREFDGTVVLQNAFNPSDTQTLRLNISEDDDGWAGILSVNYKPVKNVNLAATLITKTELNYERNVKNQFPQLLTVFDPERGTTVTAPPSTLADFPDGSQNRDDIPGQLSLGVSYDFHIPLKIDLTYVHYFERSATIETFEDEGDSWDLGITAQYNINSRWKASIGYLYTDIGLDDDQQINQPEEPNLDANSVAGGFVWSPTSRWTVTLAGAWVFYDDVDADVFDGSGNKLGNVEYSKEVWNISAGVQYKWF